MQLLLGFGLALGAVIVGYLMGRWRDERAQVRLLQEIASRTTLMQYKQDHWMKQATTLPAQEIAAVAVGRKHDPRREPDV